MRVDAQVNQPARVLARHRRTAPHHRSARETAPPARTLRLACRHSAGDRFVAASLSSRVCGVGARCSVFVPVALVCSVPASVVDVVDMVSVRHVHVPTSVTVLVRMAVVLCVAGDLAFLGVSRM